MGRFSLFILCLFFLGCDDFFRQEIQLNDDNFKKELIVQAICPADSPFKILLSHTFIQNSNFQLDPNLKEAKVSISDGIKEVVLPYKRTLTIPKSQDSGSDGNDFPGPETSEIMVFGVESDFFRTGKTYDLKITWKDIFATGKCVIPESPNDLEKKPGHVFKISRRWDYNSGFGTTGVTVFPKRDLDPRFFYLTTVEVFEKSLGEYVDVHPFLSDFLIKKDDFGQLLDSANIPFYGAYGYSSTLGGDSQSDSGKFTIMTIIPEDGEFFENLHRFYFSNSFTSEPLPLSQNLIGAHGLFIGVNKRTWCFKPNHSNGEINFEFRVCN
jgi:hypothetical protein